MDGRSAHSGRCQRPYSALFAVLACVLLGGCVSAPYNYGANDRYYTSAELAAITQPQIERGRKRPFVDGVGWVLGIPDKIVLWNRNVDNHDISLETEQAIADYLAKNDLTTVKVRLNQYAPGNDWRRLVANKSVGWGWRYSLGTLSWIAETLLPGRLIGGDHYNPFTNTLHIYSDVPAIAVHEGGHAKDFARRRYKGTYAAMYLLPVAPLWYEAIATNDALSYLRVEGSLEDEQAADKILYPAYGTYVGNSLSYVVPRWSNPMYIVGVVAGHIGGRIQANRIKDERPDMAQQSNSEVPPSAPAPESDPSPIPAP